MWEEEDVHRMAKPYNEVIARRHGKPLGRITNEERAHGEAIKKEEEEATMKAYVATTSVQSV